MGAAYRTCICCYRWAAVQVRAVHELNMGYIRDVHGSNIMGTYGPRVGSVHMSPTCFWAGAAHFALFDPLHCHQRDILDTCRVYTGLLINRLHTHYMR